MTITDNDPVNDKPSLTKEYFKFLQLHNTPFEYPIKNYNSPKLNITNSHWQLRNLIQFFSLDKDYVIYPDEQQIKWLNLKTRVIHSRYPESFEAQVNDDSFEDKFNDDEEGEEKVNLPEENEGWRVMNDSQPTDNAVNIANSSSSINEGHSKNCNFDDDEKNTLCKMSFAPKCFSEKDGIIVSGGLDDNVGCYTSNTSDGGVLHLFNSHTGTQFESKVGKVINNCVELQKMAMNDYRLFLCNNDKNFYQCSVNNSDIRPIRTIQLGYSLNNCGSMKNNKDVVLISGDSNELTLLDLRVKPKKKNGGVQTINVLTYGKDCGFSVDFHSSDLYFASAFQGGKTFIFDIRNTKSHIHHIESVRYHQESNQVYVNSCNDINNEYAFRHLKFSDNRKSVDDYLFVSEHKSRLHILDMRNFENHIITYFPSNITKSVKVIQAEDYYADGIPNDRSIYEINGLDWTGQFGENSKLIVGGSRNAQLFEINSNKRMLFQNYQLC